MTTTTTTTPAPALAYNRASCKVLVTTALENADNATLKASVAMSVLALHTGLEGVGLAAAWEAKIESPVLDSIKVSRPTKRAASEAGYRLTRSETHARILRACIEQHPNDMRACVETGARAMLDKHKTMKALRVALGMDKAKEAKAKEAKAKEAPAAAAAAAPDAPAPDAPPPDAPAPDAPAPDAPAPDYSPDAVKAEVARILAYVGGIPAANMAAADARALRKAADDLCKRIGASEAEQAADAAAADAAKPRPARKPRPVAGGSMAEMIASAIQARPDATLAA